MTTDVEFDFGGAHVSGTADEPLQPKPPPSQRWLRVLATVAISIVVVVELVARGSHSAPPRAASPSTSPASSPSAPAGMSQLQLELTAIALDVDPLVDVTRSTPVSHCPTPKASPVDAQLAALRRVFPQFTQHESSSASEVVATTQHLCSVELRAKSSGGSVFLMRVIAPPNQPIPSDSVDVEQAGGRYPHFVAAELIDDRGFLVQVAVLSTGHLPVSAGQVARLVDDGALLW